MVFPFWSRKLHYSAPARPRDNLQHQQKNIESSVFQAQILKRFVPEQPWTTVYMLQNWAQEVHTINIISSSIMYPLETKCTYTSHVQMMQGTLLVFPWETGLQMCLSAILGSQMLNVCFTYVKEAISVWQSSILKYELPKKYEIPLQQQETAFGVLQVFGLKALRKCLCWDNLQL